MRRADVDAAIASLDASLAVRPGLLTKANEDVQVVYALGMRAFLRASRGDEEGAAADARAVVASPSASGEALGFAAVADLVRLERAGGSHDREAARAHLRDAAPLLFEATGARERAIVRAYQRMLREGHASVYRVAAVREPEPPEGEEPALADWMSKVLPEAAAFVAAPPSPRSHRADAPAEASRPPSPSALRAVAAAREAAKARAPGTAAKAGRVVALWVLLILLLMAVWQLLTPDRQRVHEAPSPVDVQPLLSVGALFPLLFAGLFVAVFAWQILAGRRDARQLVRAQALVARGWLDDATAVLDPLTKGKRAMGAATAHLMLAQIAQRRSDLAAALQQTDLGIARLHAPAMRAASADQLLPGLIEERAVVLAAQGRPDEADAELAGLVEPYPFIERARLRVRLVQLARGGRLSDAALLAARHERDWALSRRDELLVDVLLAGAMPETIGAAEVLRVKEELRGYPEGRRWLETVAPAALAALEGAPEVATDPEPASDRESERDAAAAAEAEAEGEAEAALGARGAARRLG